MAPLGTERRTLRQALKAETDARHRRLETRLDLLGAHLDEAAYRQLLERFYGFYVALEPALAASATWMEFGVAYADRLKRPRLESDLAALGASKDEIAALPRCEVLPEVATAERAIGCMYVIEGSTLGGQVLSRHFASSIGVSPERGGAFFAGYGPETGARWGAFTRLLAAFDEAEWQREAIEAACETFDRLEAWLTVEAPR